MEYRYISQNAGSSMQQYVTRADLKKLLEVLNASNETKIHAKIFSLFAIHLISGNGTCNDVIITCPSVYDKIYKLLNKGLPSETATTLNFVSALVYESEELELAAYTSRQSLVLYARNMLRSSGCLSVMCSLFNSCMMHQNTWRALCRCLAEVCQNVQENQNYCSDLISTAVRRSLKGDADAACLLQCLLHNHSSNIRMFVECNGLSMFTRQLLQNNIYLMLLNIVAQNSETLVMLVNNSKVVDILRSFLELYGTECQICQWAIIILHHIKSQIKDEHISQYVPFYNNTQCSSRLHKQGKNITLTKNGISCYAKKMANYEHVENGIGVDTEKLFQNIAREIAQFEDNCENLGRVTNILSRDNIRFTGQHDKNEVLQSRRSITYSSNTRTKSNDKRHNQFTAATFTNDMSFSFLLDQNSYESPNDVNSINLNSETHVRNIMQQDFASDTDTVSRKYINTKIDTLNRNYTDQTVIDFKPTCVSTPKKERTTSQIAPRFLLETKNNKEEISKIHRNDKLKLKRSPVRKSKGIGHRSLSGTLFSAINNSCTILVKTVKNIFRTKKMDNDIKREVSTLSTLSGVIKEPCNYSFTNYMRRRDAIFENKLSANLKLKENVPKFQRGSSCETCNDTELLKNKLRNDSHLKQTIKKLKLGINLYGCDFKKISATLWPRESYMTPNVLYHLYRKLIVK